MRTLIESPRVRSQVEAMRPGQPVHEILHRGNYPNNMFLVVYQDGTSERLTVPPISKKRGIGLWERS
jgi:hypothetical protein